MNIYDQLVKIAKKIRKKYDIPLTNMSVSSAVSADLTLIVVLVLSCLILRHLNILLSGILALLVGAILVMNMPLIPKFKSEQSDSLNAMLFYIMLVLGILITIMYWGGNLV